MRDLTPTPDDRPVEDRQFRLYDVVFTVRSRVSASVIDSLAMFAGAAESPDGLVGLLDQLDANIVRALESATTSGVPVDAEQAWRELRSDPARVVDLDTIVDVAVLCVEAATGRPPTQPESSSAPADTHPRGTRSTDASASPATPTEPTDSTHVDSATSSIPR